MKGELVALAFKYIKLALFDLSSAKSLFLSRSSSLISKERIYLKMEELSEESNRKEKAIQTQTREPQ